jgi:hypothetical protein
VVVVVVVGKNINRLKTERNDIKEGNSYYIKIIIILLLFLLQFSLARIVTK